MQEEFELGDRKVGIGHNQGPALDDEDESPPTPEEARIVYGTIEYVKFKCPNLDDFMAKKKGKRKLGWRLLVFNLLRDRVRQGSIKQLLGYNRKTVGENQQRADSWAELDPEFEDHLCRFRAAAVADSQVDVEGTEALLLHWVKEDPGLRKLEERARLHLAAAEEAEKAADAMRAKAAARESDKERMARAKAVAKLLKNKENGEALSAQQMGARIVAEKLSEEGITVLSQMISSPDGRKPKSALNAAGLDRCIRLGIARKSEPSTPKGAPEPPDPRYGMTGFGEKVAEAALELGRIEKKKRKKKTIEEDDED